MLLTIPTHNIEVEDWDQSSPEAFRILGQPVVLASAQSGWVERYPKTPLSFDLFCAEGVPTIQGQGGQSGQGLGSSIVSKMLREDEAHL